MILIVFLILFSTLSHAEDSIAKRRQDVSSLAKSTSPQSLPGFVTGNPPEVSLNDISALESASERVFETNKHAQDLKEMSEVRPYFVVDGEKDPVFTHSQEVTRDPEAFLQGELHNRIPHLTYLHKTCRESKPQTKLKCSKVLLTPEIHIEPARYAHYWCTSGMHRPDDSRCRAKKYYNPARKYKDEVIRITSEQWTNRCLALEEQTRLGVCRLIKTECPRGEETHEVSGSLGNTAKTVPRQITRPCWRYELTYECSHASPNTCEPLRHSGCEQMASNCFTKIGKKCVEWEQTYRCPKEPLSYKKEHLSEAGYELHHPNQSLTYKPNRDMGEAIAKLSIFQKIQDEMRQSPTVENIKVFKGLCRKCTIAFAGFKNCCRAKKGWGLSLKVSQCSSEAKELAVFRKQKRCIEVGTFCAEKHLGVCTRKKRSYCCFPSKLSRILQNQGRAQLGIGWGNPEHPNCRGLTPEELSRIDFDRLNMSEIFEEVVARAKKVSAKVVKRKLSQNVHNMTTGFGNRTNREGF